MDLLFSKNRNKEVFESLKGATISNVYYSDLRDGEDYVTLHLTDGRQIILRSQSTNQYDITWIQAEIKGA